MWALWFTLVGRGEQRDPVLGFGLREPGKGEVSRARVRVSEKTPGIGSYFRKGV